MSIAWHCSLRWDISTRSTSATNFYKIHFNNILPSTPKFSKWFLSLAVGRAMAQAVSRLGLTKVDRWRHSVSDVVEYVTTEKLLDSIFNILPVFICQWEIQTHWVYTGWLFLILKLSSWNISDNLHKLRIYHRMYFSHYKQNTCVSQIWDGSKTQKYFLDSYT
jgi:hypothetical protein